VEQDYLPDGLVGRRFYQPKEQGQEPKLSLFHLQHLKKKAKPQG
jgi:putative ATPase